MRKANALLTVALALMLTTPAGAQDVATSAVWQTQAGMIRRIFAGLGTASVQRQLFGLWMADLILASEQESGTGGLEEMVAGGALGTLQALSRSENAEVRSAAESLRARITTDLGIDDATPARATPITLTADAPVILKSVEYERWLAIRTTPGLEYSVDARDCPMLRAVALGSDRQRALGGATAFGGGIRFLGQIDETAYLRVRTPLCEAGGSVSLSLAVPAVPVAAASNRDAAQAITAGTRYRGTLSEGVEHWFRFSAQAAQRYVATTAPSNAELDTVVTVFRTAGTSELVSDDDSGIDLGSRVEFARPDGDVLLIKVASIGGTGNYELRVAPMQSPVQLARPIAMGGSQDGALTATALEGWWSLMVEGGRRYTFETTPLGGLDTILSVFDAEGTIELESNDDGGSEFGSRIDFTNSTSGRLLLRVRGVNDSVGDYKLAVISRATVPALAAADTMTAAPLVTVPNTYQGSLRAAPQQWIRFNVRPNMMYVIETVPDGDLDTLVTVYDAAGSAIDEDDDDGPGVGSRVELTNGRNEVLFVKISRYGSAVGDYDLSITERGRPIDEAQVVMPGGRVNGTLTESALQQWWKIDVQPGRTYVFETIPAGSLDTVLTLFQMDGITQIATDDDGGTGMGSKLEFASTDARQLLIKVQGYDDSTGTYQLTVLNRTP